MGVWGWGAVNIGVSEGVNGQGSDWMVTRWVERWRVVGWMMDYWLGERVNG